MFKTLPESLPFPKVLNDPFFVVSHPAIEAAVKDLQTHLLTQKEWSHDFGLEEKVDGVNVGKMFGVLLVENDRGECGYLAAFSGKLAGASQVPGFVEPVADILFEDSFFRKGEKEIEGFSAQIASIQMDPVFEKLQDRKKELQNRELKELRSFKERVSQAKGERQKIREELKEGAPSELKEKTLFHLGLESQREQKELKELKASFKKQWEELKAEIAVFENKLARLEEFRKERSKSLQKEIFDQYQFLNVAGETKGLWEIFKETPLKQPPSGAGDCAAPKLFQAAFKRNLKPLGLTEFWWGQAPKSEVRHHGHLYPACRGKCAPILKHMLQGTSVESAFQEDQFKQHTLEIVFEDEALLVVKKPSGLPSVPGNSGLISLYDLLFREFPKLEGPVIVHRLDMDTSGLMVVAKTLDSYRKLQEQFLERKVKKKYCALVDGKIQTENGEIHLPLASDYLNRPRQVVDFAKGKVAKTHWVKVAETGERTLVHFFPITGRTHQLRVHAAHQDGLACPIVGDDLYGKKGGRLCLHAERLEFKHPKKGTQMSFEWPERFGL